MKSRVSYCRATFLCIELLPAFLHIHRELNRKFGRNNFRRAQTGKNQLAFLPANRPSVSVLKQNCITPKMKTIPTLYSAVIALTLACVAVESRGADATPTTTNKWESSIAAGATLTRGNSETFLGTLTAATGKKWNQNEMALGADMAYGTTKNMATGNNDTTAETVHGFAQYNRLFNERLYGYGRVEGLHDGVADIDYRLSLSVGAGYYFIKTKETQLSAEVGPGYLVERLGSENKSYATLRVGEKFNQVLSDRARLWQTAEIVPQVDDFNNYIVNFEIGVEADLNSSQKLSLRVYLDDTYNNVPAAGRKKNDLKLVAAIAYKF
jgi:putative salt-induced outer membrane protein